MGAGIQGSVSADSGFVHILQPETFLTGKSQHNKRVLNTYDPSPFAITILLTRQYLPKAPYPQLDPERKKGRVRDIICNVKLQGGFTFSGSSLPRRPISAPCPIQIGIFLGNEVITIPLPPWLMRTINMASFSPKHCFHYIVGP